VSFDDHDRCRRCGTPDGPGHTATECERVRAQRAEAQKAHDAANEALPVVTRRTDGKRFRIVTQARSPDGPVHLIACDGPPFESATVNGLVFVHAYDDPRKTAPLHDPLASSDRCGHGAVCAWMRVAADAQTVTSGLAFRRREMEHPDTLRPVVRYVVALAGTEPRIARACPVCGGNPNAEAL
jgi:hypothetical protein